MNNGILDKIEQTPGHILLTFSSFFLILYLNQELLLAVS